MKQNEYYGGYGSSREDTLFAAKEAYRTIRTNLMFSVARSDCKTVMFTSSIQGEGKTTTAVNIAFSIARSNKKVLLLDLDLRKPSIHRVLKQKSIPGLTNFLSGYNSLEEVLHKELYPNLDVICAGTIPPNPAEMVASDGMIRLLEEMKKQYDFIILDTPPLNLVSDALSIISHTDGMVLVIRPKYTARNEVQKALSQVEFVGGKVLGIVANGVQDRKRSYRRYYRYGRSGYGNERNEMDLSSEKAK